MRSRRLVKFERERFETPDGDDLWIDRVLAPAGRPRLIVLHGLEGSSFSPYVQGLISQAMVRGWDAVAFNCRSCARDLGDTITPIPNRARRLYHSGDTSDFDWFVRTLHQREPDRLTAVVGISMGGNVLLKWLGENPGQRYVAAAAAWCAPYDLGVGARHLERRVGRAYVEHFLSSLRLKVRQLVARHPEVAQVIDVDGGLRARDFRPFDEAVTAPLYGFENAEDFYRRGSSLAVIDRITTPTLCLSAENDPIIPKSLMARVKERATPALELLFTRGGGHVGYITGTPWRPRYWAEEVIIEWLADKLAASQAATSGGVGPPHQP